MNLDELERLLPEVARILGVPLDETPAALRGEAPTALLESPEEIALLVHHSLCRIIGMEVVVP